MLPSPPSTLDGHALVNALLYGRLDGLGEEWLFLFARTGLVHLFSASGFHLSSAALLAEGIVRPFRLLLPPGRPYLIFRFALRLGLMLFFGAATDWSSPMVRAFVFSVLMAAADLLESRASVSRVFLLSLVASAALGRGGQLSFLLSACGMAGVLFVQPRRAWAIALGPWAFTLPITIWCFGLFSPLAPLWNLTFGSAISWLVLPPAILALVLDQFGLPSEVVQNFSALVMTKLVVWLSVAESSWGWSLWVRPLPWVLVSAGLLAGALLWEKRKKAAATGIALASLLCARLLPLPDLAMLDVGQGDALLLRQNGAWTLSDLGPPGFGFPAPLTSRIESLGIGEIGAVVLSHPDLDHRGGLASLLLRHPVKALWIRESVIHGKAGMEILAEAERASVPIRFLSEESAPLAWRCWPGPPGARGNEASPLCLAETDGRRKVLITGDMGSETEFYFLSRLEPFPRANYLKVAHHGSRKSSSENFLRASRAEVALIGVGKKNRYGHPSREVLARLEAAGMRVQRTDREGSLVFYGPYHFWAGNEASGGSATGFTEEIMRTGSPSRWKPGTPDATRRPYASSAWVK